MTTVMGSHGAGGRGRLAHLSHGSYLSGQERVEVHELCCVDATVPDVGTSGSLGIVEIDGRKATLLVGEDRWVGHEELANLRHVPSRVHPDVQPVQRRRRRGGGCPEMSLG